MILHETGSPPGKSLKLSQLCGPGSAICDAGWPTPDCPWSMLVCRSQKKCFRNFNFNFNYRELLSKSATFSLRSFGVVKHPILIDNPVALCHVFFGGFVVALACVALWRGHMRCRILTSFLLTACHNLSYRHVEMRNQLFRSCQLRKSLSMCRL